MAVRHILKSGRRKANNRINRQHRKNKTGMFSPDFNQFRRKGGRNSAIKRGYIPYDSELRYTEFGFIDEGEYIIFLRRSCNYSWNETIARSNSVFGNNRNANIFRTNYNGDNWEWKWLLNLW